MDSQFKKSFQFLTMSDKYLNLVKNVLDENVKQGNLHIITSDEEIFEKDYEEKTKWSDFNIFPILFNFYHGLELLLKGLLSLKESYVLRSKHHIDNLFDDFKKEYADEKEMVLILEKYLILDLMPDLLANCVRANNLEIKNLYEFFRYPYDVDFKKSHNYIGLKHRKEDGRIFFQELSKDISFLLKEAINLLRINL